MSGGHTEDARFPTPLFTLLFTPFFTLFFTLLFTLLLTRIRGFRLYTPAFTPAAE